MIVCPSCQHEEPVGSLFCCECGSSLSHLEESPPETLIVEKESVQKQGVEMESSDASLNSTPSPDTGASVSIKVLETGNTIHLEDGEEFILGRVGGKQPILPDVDLTSYGAYEEGVSRLHAIIKISKEHVNIIDLGSANGTLINGRRIIAHKPFPLEHGDLVTLGKFKTEILFK